MVLERVRTILEDACSGLDYAVEGLDVGEDSGFWGALAVCSDFDHGERRPDLRTVNFLIGAFEEASTEAARGARQLSDVEESLDRRLVDLRRAQRQLEKVESDWLDAPG